jgi:hypothetical protein
VTGRVVADAVSDGAGYITGPVAHVDVGWLARN